DRSMPTATIDMNFLTRVACAATAIALAVAGAQPAAAACDPQAADGVSATCTGATVNQGGGAPGTSAGNFGYGTGIEGNVSVTVVPGATVTGSVDGIALDSGITIVNSGSISGGGLFGIGVAATSITSLVNDGSIFGPEAGVEADAIGF